MAGPTTFVDKITSKVGGFLGLNGTGIKANSGFDIGRFKSEIGAYGIEPTNLFLVQIFESSPDALAVSHKTQRMLSFFCHRTTLPGRNLMVEENIVNGIGPTERFVHNSAPTDLELSFFGDQQGYILERFKIWINGKIIETETRASKDYYKVAYKDTYVATIAITVFDSNSNKIIEYRFNDAFPYVVSPVPMSWADQNNFMNIDVGFYYTDYTMKISKVPESENVTNDLSLLQKAIKLGTIATTVLPMRRPNSIADVINVVNNANIVAPAVSDLFR